MTLGAYGADSWTPLNSKSLPTSVARSGKGRSGTLM